MKDQVIKNEVTRAIVLEAVLGERERQDIMYGNQSGHSDMYWNIRFILYILYMYIRSYLCKHHSLWRGGDTFYSF